MRLLAIETSTHRGSVAAVSRGQIVAHAVHDEPNRHAERMLSLIERTLKEAHWEKHSIDRVAVGVGPGAFTGVRVGLSLASGLSLGLDAELVGVVSLRAIAFAHPAADRRLRVILRDARRQEYFLAVYRPDGEEVVGPRAVARQSIVQEVHSCTAGEPFVVLGEEVGGLPCERGAGEALPDAGPLGVLATSLDPKSHPARPCYLRGPGAIRPNLAPSPLLLPRE